MMEPICLITGATEGIGRDTAIQLAAKGFTVILAARSAAKAELIKREIASITGRTDVDYIVAELNSLRQVCNLAETFKRRYPRLDVLINNAGIFAPRFVLTEDGYETTFQVNYLSHFLLTQLLLDGLRKSPQGRIINLSSSVYAAGKFDEANLQSEKGYSIFGAYSASKLFMLLSSLEQAERLRETSITVNAVHPGIVRTNMMLRAPGAFKIVSWLALPAASSPKKGAATSVYLAASPEVRTATGRYFARGKAADIKTRFNTAPTRRRLWEISVGSLRERGLLDS